MFRIHRSERADALVDALVDALATVPADPFVPEIVAVPTRGVERWLTHRIGATLGTSAGGHDGVCANVEFPFPGRLVGDVVATASGLDPATDPWRPDRLVWPVLSVLDEHAGAPWLGLVAAHFGADPGGHPDDHDDLRRSRRWGSARHIADLFDRYGVFRPSMVRDWLARTDADDAHDPHLPADARWQPALLRRVRDHVDVAPPAARIEDACARLAAGDVELDLPERLSLFGLTRLPPTHLAVLRAVAAERDVHLYALHPSLRLWDRIAALDVDPAGLTRDEDPTRAVPEHPLLATWAHDSREMQVVLSAAAEADVAHRPPPGDGEPTTLLGRLQHAIRADVAPPPAGEEPAVTLAADDRSVQVHACHGRARQVEVLRDAICHLLAADPTLEPRDVIVLCPDIDEFAPLLHATFGCHPATDDDPADDGGDVDAATGLPRLPYRLADRSLRQTNPLLAALDEVLDLVEHRLTTTEVLAFAGRPPVRRRFGLDDDALDRIAGWATDAGVRWGLDADHRARWHLEAVADHTWRAGLDRLLLGVAMDEDDARLVGDRLPFDDVDGGDVDLVGRLAELVDRLATVVEACRGRHSLADWVVHLGTAADLLFAPPPADEWQRVQLDTILREVLEEAGGGADHELDLGEVRDLLGRRLEGMPTRADFRTGALTMCTLVPMRAVPHRVVCVLGLDDGAFPRNAPADGDDLLLRRPLVGDRDARTEDRQLLLDAVLAATESLVITYSGRDERTNETRPPSVPLHELLAVLDRTARSAAGTPAGQDCVVHHPLQPFDPRSFRTPEPWGFDRTQLAGARAALGDRHRPPPFVATALPPRDEVVVAVDDLVRFVQHPVREFLRQRLGLQVWEDDDSLPEAIPIELDGLARWAIGDRLLGQLRRGVDVDAAVRAEIGRGMLPPGELRHGVLRETANTALAIDALARAEHITGPPSSVEIDVAVPTDDGDIRLVGTVPRVHGHLVTEVSYSTLSARTRLALWVRLLAASVAEPDQAWTSIGIGRAKSGGRLVRHRPIGGDGVTAGERHDRALDLLARLADLRRRGLCEPLPLPCKTAEAWASAVHRNRSPREEAARQWRDGKFPGEMSDASAVRVFGAACDFETLVGIAAAASEQGPGWTDEASRLGRLALRLWEPILAQEVWR